LVATEPLCILIIGRDVGHRTHLGRLLRRSRLAIGEICNATSLEGAWEALRNYSFDIILLDLGPADGPGAERILPLQARAPQVPLIVLVEGEDDSRAARAVRMGVQDCLIRGQMTAALLAHAVRHAVERKKAERQLQAAERRYRTIFENSAVAIMLADTEERLVSWNRFTERLLGMGEAELRGREVRTLYPQAEWLRLRALNTRRKGMQHHLETKMVRGDGQVIDVDISLSVVQDPEGRVTGSVGVVQDITERKRIHEILDRKQKNLEAIFDAAPLGMLLVDEHMAVMRANDTVRQISGRDYRDIIGRDICAALACRESGGQDDAAGEAPACERCALRSVVQQVLTRGTALRGVELRPPLGEQRTPSPPWLAASVVPVHVEGGRHVVVALHDVTERKRAEEELRAAMEMKSQFLSTVSHELRTPLTAMKEAVMIVLDGVAGKINKDQGHFLDIAKRNIERLARLIDDVLDFQRLNVAKMKFHMERNHIAAAVDEAYATMQPHAMKSGVELVVEVEPNLPTAVYDHDRIIQVLTNLISNALKFTPAGGRVLVSARHDYDPGPDHVSPDDRGGLPLADGGPGARGESTIGNPPSATAPAGRRPHGPGYLVLKVSDTGLGIPKEDLPKVFDAFYRVQRPGKEIKGTGLGLAIVSRIVAEHGGRVEVESEPAQGSTFTVLLPLTPVPPTDALNLPADEHIERTLAGR
jgi:PAS domain S-box-containing protein